MKTHFLLPIVLLAACSTPPARPEMPPMRLAPPRAEVAPPVSERAPTDDLATQRWLEQRLDRPRQVETARKPTDEAATQQWLDQQIEYQNTVNPPRPPEPIYQVIEKPVYVDRPVYYSGSGYDSRGEPVYYHDRRYRGETFPVNTLIGAGLGYAIGGHKHHDRGAAIGAGVGLLFDIGNAIR